MQEQRVFKDNLTSTLDLLMGCSPHQGRVLVAARPSQYGALLCNALFHNVTNTCPVHCGVLATPPAARAMIAFTRQRITDVLCGAFAPPATNSPDIWKSQAVSVGSFSPMETSAADFSTRRRASPSCANAIDALEFNAFTSTASELSRSWPLPSPAKKHRSVSSRHHHDRNNAFFSTVSFNNSWITTLARLVPYNARRDVCGGRTKILSDLKHS